MTDEKPTASFAMPQPFRAIIGRFLFEAFVCFFVVLAIHNLFNGVGIIASSLWLLLVGAVLFSFCKLHGIGMLLTGALGAFARKQFAWAFPTAAGQTEIRFGYQIFGVRHFYFAPPAGNIESVNWRTGQASAMAGRDVDDWSVALWYDPRDTDKIPGKVKLRKLDQEVYIVGLSGPRNKVAAFGQKFLTFLSDAGVRLVPGRERLHLCP
jgi:hypothetical protein